MVNERGRDGPHGGQGPVTIFGPDFPFPFDDWIAHPAGLGSIPAERHGQEVAVVDAYASSFTRAGYGDAIKAIRAAHLAGDRAGALAAIPDEMVDAIEVTGDEALVRGTISAYQRAGVDIPVVFPLTWGAAGQDGLESTLRAAIAPPASAAHGT